MATTSPSSSFTSPSSGGGSAAAPSLPAEASFLVNHINNLVQEEEDMEGKFIFLSWAVIFCIEIAAAPVHGDYYSTRSAPRATLKEKVTNIHFFLHDTQSGKNPTAVRVAQPNTTSDTNSVVAFGKVFAVDDPMTVGLDPKSDVIGNAQGLYVFTGRNATSTVVYFDFGFTTGKFNGSSISVFSRNPILDVERELAVVGGRGKFRMAKGFAQLKTRFVNFTSGDAIVEYHVTVFHY